jgi:16S rRNA (guanine966-N2)-methyltransferase
MRIVGGSWRGRRLASPPDRTTRPTSDRVKESLFSALESRYPDILEGAAVLDAFAGTGALGLEALSRGAASATFVESDGAAWEALRENVSMLGAHGCEIVRGDVLQLAEQGRIPGGPFALLLLDPPYRIDQAQVRGLVVALHRSGAIGPETVIVFEHDARNEPSWPDGFRETFRRTYGDTAIAFAVSERGV